jgi:hypothetical protein
LSLAEQHDLRDPSQLSVSGGALRLRQPKMPLLTRQERMIQHVSGDCNSHNLSIDIRSAEVNAA